jgi:hypothetical protein
MILRFTKKLADKLKIKSPKDCEYEVNPFEEWYGHLFTANRIQYILFTNAYSLYSSIIPAKGILTIRDFMDLNFSCLDEVLKNDGLEMIMEKYITPKTEVIEICKTNNRAILGSMNDMINHSKIFLIEYKLPTIEISKRLNETPFSYIKYKRPLSMIKQLLIN